MKVTIELDGLEFGKAIEDGAMATLCAAVAGVQGDVVVATPAHEPAEKPKPAKEQAAPQEGPGGIDLDSFRLRVAKVNKAAEGNIDKVQQLVGKAGYKKLSEVKPEDRMPLLLEIEALV